MNYLIVGAGKIAKHLEHYLTLAALAEHARPIPSHPRTSNPPSSVALSPNRSMSSLLTAQPLTWNRSQDVSILKTFLDEATHVLLAISDSSLEGFYREHLLGLGKTVVHFSGAIYFEGAIAAHPLMSFGPDLYPISTYEKIHFALTGCSSLNEALPGLRNAFSVLTPEQKPLYHALCVMGGNFPVILWQKMFQDFAKLGIPPQAAHGYLQTVLANTLANPATALTGPLARKDAATIAKNLESLHGDSFEGVYRAFVEAVSPELLSTLNRRQS